ncbi:MAG: gliding motility-associated ABC transporter substrate-binding protein GldG [Saprospiraceae bacterium]|nr:gliding motility-associated ABC transporter substrate-binding protein GldG [Saprospiraceae bacterium]
MKNFVLRNLNILLVLGVILFINIIAHYYHAYLDLTEEKRFTLTQSTINNLNKLNNTVHFQVLLDGEFPSGFKKLQQSTKDILNQFATESPYIEFTFENPNEGTIEEINTRRKALTKDGLIPTNLMVKSGSENKEQIIFPYAIANLGEKKIAINLLEEQRIDMDQDEDLGNSISLLEYKLANGIQKALQTSKKNVLISTGHGELSDDQTQALSTLLYQFFNVGKINLDTVPIIKKEADLLIIPKPSQPFSEKNKFTLDQYVMNGGKIIFLLDRISMSIDSMNTRKEYIPEPLDLNLEDLLFKYGFRIEPGFVLDLECTRIPQVIGQQGNKPQIELFPWYYHPLIASYSNHPIVANIDRVSSEFPSFIDTLKTKSSSRKTILLNSSRYSRYQLAPMKIDFEILRYTPQPEKFNKPFLPIAVLAEGEFSSLYENRVDENMLIAMRSANLEYKNKSTNTSIMVVADGDIVKNLFDKESGKFAPLGYHKFEKRTFNGNKDFILNSIEYMINPDNVLLARSKEIKLRMLDKVKAEKEVNYWQFLNIGAPLIGLLLFGIFNFQWRKKKYIKAQAA